MTTTIGEQEIKAVGVTCERLMRERLLQIADAYLKFSDDDESFKVAFSAEFKPSKKIPGAIDIKTDIAFNPEPKVKDSIKETVGDPQGRMFKGDAPERNTGPFRMTPRYLIDMTSRPHCQMGPGPHCTLKAPCWHCEGRDHADSLTFSERNTREQENAKIRKLTKPASKKELPEGVRRAAAV